MDSRSFCAIVLSGISEFQHLTALKVADVVHISDFLRSDYSSPAPASEPATAASSAAAASAAGAAAGGTAACGAGPSACRQHFCPSPCRQHFRPPPARLRMWPCMGKIWKLKRLNM